MKRLLFSVFALLLTLTALVRAQAAVTAPTADASTKPSIFVCGDSTSKFSGGETMESEMQGWGTPLFLFFNADKVAIKNVGHAGTSSLTYYYGDWPKVLTQIKTGDFVLIVFGINDGSTPNTTGDETQKVTVRNVQYDGHNYSWYMSKMTTEAQAKGAHVVLLTVTTRNIWKNPAVVFRDATPTTTLPADYNPKKDTIERGTGNGKYTQLTKDVGKKLNTPVFDLTNFCADRYETMGRVEVSKLYRDHNHTHAPGAKIVAESIVAGLKALKDSPFTPLLNDAGKAVAPADAKYVSDNTAP